MANKINLNRWLRIFAFLVLIVSVATIHAKTIHFNVDTNDANHGSYWANADLWGSTADSTIKCVDLTDGFIQMLLDRGVSLESVLGVDSSGIPIVCGVTGQAGGTELMIQRLTDAGVPFGTRGWETIPNVIRDDGIETFRVEIDVNGPVRKVTMDNISNYLIPSELPPFELHDDGLGEDRIAGDYVYTSGLFRFDTSKTLPAFYEHDPNSPAGLYVDAVAYTMSIEELDGATTRFLLPPAVGFLRSGIPDVNIITLSPDIAVSSHLINISSSYRATQRFLHVSGVSFIPDLTNRIYEVIPDSYDFLMFFSTNKIEKLPYTSSSNFNAGVHATVQVNYTGTGLNLFNDSNSYGSSGRLLGINAIDTYDRGIWGANATHEIIHQWSAYINPSLGLSDGSHFNGRSSIGSLVGGFMWVDNGDGSFTINCDEGRNGAHQVSPLDKYMMGLIDTNEVPVLYAYSEESRLPLFKCNDGELVLAEEIVTSVTIDDIQSIHGVRSPGPMEAQRNFAIAFIAETHERLLNPTEMTFYNILARHYTKVLPQETPDPYVGQGWQPITRFFGEGTTWSSCVILNQE